MSSSEKTDFMRIRQYVINTIAVKGAQPVRFPSSRKLGEMFQVSQPTALRAIQDLIAEGFLEPCRGGGTISRQVELSQDSPRTQIFGYVLNDGKLTFHGFYSMLLLSAAAGELTRRRISYQVQDIHVETPSLLRKEVRNANLSGLMLLAADPPIMAQALKLKKEGFPVVSFTRDAEGISSVYDPLEELYRDMLLKLFSEGRTRILVCSHPLAYMISATRKGIRTACEMAGVPEEQVILLCEGLIKDQKKLQELLTFGIRFEGVILPNPALCSTIRTKMDIENECRIVLDESRMYDQLNFSGYVVKYDYPSAARILIDNLIDQTEMPEKAPLIKEKIHYQIFPVRNGVIQPEIRTNSKQGERIP